MRYFVIIYASSFFHPFFFFLLDKLQDAEDSKRQMKQELAKVKEEKNSVHKEYKLVMSEREPVHQEIQDLQENLVCIKVCVYFFSILIYNGNT